VIESNLPIAIVLPPWIAALLVPLLALHRPARARAIVLLAAVLSLVAAVMALASVASGAPLVHEFGGWAAPIGIVFRVDGLSAVMAVLVAGMATLVFVYAGASVAAELPGGETGFLAAASLLVASLQGMSVTGDLFNLYVFIEIASITAYTLIGLGGPAGAVASFRYLLIGSIGATFYLFGLAFLLALTGTLNMVDMAQRLPAVGASPAMLVGLALIVTGLGLKTAIFPMHGWLPDAYATAPSAATALIASLMTKVNAYALVRVVYGVVWPTIAPLDLPLFPLLAPLAAAGILAGSVMALAQRDLRRLLAYSSVGNLGYIALGLALGNANGLLGAMLHIVGHGVAKGCLFLIAGAMRLRGAGEEEAFDELARRMPVSSFAFLVAALSLIGVPPTIGFFSKWYLLLGCLDRGSWLLVAVLLVSTWLNLWYFFRLIERFYFGRSESAEAPGRAEAPASMLVPIALTATLAVAIGLGSYGLVRDVLRPAVDALPLARVGG